MIPFIKISKQKKSGFTLLELIVTLGILFMFMGSILLSYNNVKKICNSLQVDSCMNNILCFINKSKLYCRNKGAGGDIIFDTVKKELKFKVGVMTMDMYGLPNEFTLNDLVNSGVKNQIHIDNFGFTSDACTITFKDAYNMANILTICVGTAYTEIK